MTTSRARLALTALLAAIVGALSCATDTVGMDSGDDWRVYQLTRLAAGAMASALTLVLMLRLTAHKDAVAAIGLEEATSSHAAQRGEAIHPPAPAPRSPALWVWLMTTLLGVVIGGLLGGQLLMNSPAPGTWTDVLVGGVFFGALIGGVPGFLFGGLVAGIMALLGWLDRHHKRRGASPADVGNERASG